MGGEQIFNAAAFLASAVGCVATGGLGCVVFGILDLVSLFLNPVRFFQQLLAGTPTNEKTMLTGARLAIYSNDPWLKGLGLSIWSVARYYNVVLSRPGDDSRWFGPMIQATVNRAHLTRQGEILLLRYIYLGQPLPAGFPKGFQSQPSDPTPLSKTCPPGFELDPKTETCVAKPNLGCVDGMHRVGQVCRPCNYDPTINPCPPPPPPQCPPGYHREGLQCVKNAPMPPPPSGCCREKERVSVSQV